MEDSINNFVMWQMTSWEDAVKLANMLPENWIFRGQENTDWSLTTSLERYHKAENREDYWRQKDAEKKMLETIKRQGHLLLEKTPRTYDDIDWLAILQHHGAVTRLLDFTASFYVATYFAVEKLQTDAVVWAIDQRFLNTAIIDRAEQITVGTNSDIPQFICDNEPHTDFDFVDKLTRKIADFVLHDDSEHSGVVAVSPWRLNERMIKQQGLFLLPLGLAREFEYHLCKTLLIEGDKLPTKANKNLDEIKELLPQWKPKLIRIEIPKRFQNKILCDLKRMNITAATLFPGLDGFARSLNYFASGYRAIDNQDRSNA